MRAKLLTASMTAFVAAIATSGVAAAQCLPAIQETGELLVAVGLMGTKPYVWKNDQTGLYEGYEPELLEELTTRIGIDGWDYAITEWTTMIPGLKAERWDAIFSGMSVTQERVQGAGIEFSDPYFMLYDHVIVLEDSPITTMDDLKDKTVASPLGTLDAVNAQMLVDAGKAAEFMAFNTFNEPFVALTNGQVDAVVLDQGTLLGMREEITNLRTVGEPIFYQPKPEWVEAEAAAPYRFGATAMGMRADCTDLRDAVNAALKAMDEDGTRQRILEKYGAWSPEQVTLMK